MPRYFGFIRISNVPNYKGEAPAYHFGGFVPAFPRLVSDAFSLTSIYDQLEANVVAHATFLQDEGDPLPPTDAQKAIYDLPEGRDIILVEVSVEFGVPLPSAIVISSPGTLNEIQRQYPEIKEQAKQRSLLEMRRKFE